MSPNALSEFKDSASSYATNGSTVLFGVLIAALVGVTLLAALHDITSDAVVAIYSAIIAGGVGHTVGKQAGRLQAENDRLTSVSSDASKGNNS